MLVPFCIDSESLAPDPSWTQSQVYQCHLALLHIWRRIGLLAYDGDRFDHSRLKTAIEILPPKLKSLWQDALEHYPLVPVGESWNGTITDASVDLLSQCASIGLVDDVRAEVEFGFADDELSRINTRHNDFEVSRIYSSAQSTHFIAAEQSSGKHIEPGETFADIWKNRFLTLARSGIKRVSIVDRYAIGQLFNRPHQQLSGLERFLRLLDADANGSRHVKVYSSWADLLERTSDSAQYAFAKEEKANEIREEIRFVLSKLPRKQIASLTVILVPNSRFGDIAHDRFIRFDNYVWDIGLGLKVLAGAFAEERSSASFKYGEVVDGYRKVERELECEPSAKSISVR